MNPSDVDDRCLPSVSKWTRRSERQEFIDICASPPSDGFFYSNQHRMNRQQHTAIGGCIQETENPGDNNMGQNIPRMAAGGGETTVAESKVACFTNETTGFFKTFTPTPGYPSTNGGGDVKDGEGSGSGLGSGGSLLTRKVLNMSSADLEKWAKKNINRAPGPAMADTSVSEQHSTDDSAPTPIDHLVARNNQPPPMITKTMEGGSARLLEKYGTPDVTPSTTPAVTPACSPQVTRRPGNPFFTGDSSKNEEGNWLFRSATRGSDNIMYEAKMDLQGTTSSETGKKRYVPRPSQLRELNFWSPTSM